MIFEMVYSQAVMIRNHLRHEISTDSFAHTDRFQSRNQINCLLQSINPWTKFHMKKASQTLRLDTFELE